MQTTKKTVIAGWVISAIPGLVLLFSSVLNFMHPPAVVQGMEHLGWPGHLALPLGIVCFLSTVLYLVPRTQVLGAILLTAYFGGATATHVRVGEPWFLPVIFGILVWGGLYLRDARIRALIPMNERA
jgi:hypothetical protein